MNLIDIKVVSLQPTALSVLWEGGSAEIIEANDGEAFIRIGELPVERYTLIMNGENPADVPSLYKAIADFENKQILIPDENALMGFRPVDWDLIGVMPSVANFEGNLAFRMISVEHSYRAKTFMPSLRKDLLVSYSRAEDVEPTWGFYFGDLMDFIRGLSDKYKCQWMVTMGKDNIMLTAAYEGARDNRHLEMNGEFDARLGVRNE